MWQYLKSFYSTPVSVCDSVFNECVKQLKENGDSTPYEFVEKIYIDNPAMIDLHQSYMILVKYKKRLPLNQIIGLCVYANNSNGENQITQEKVHSGISVLHKVFDKFNTKIFNQGILAVKNYESFQEVDALIYNVLIVRNKQASLLFI